MAALGTRPCGAWGGYETWFMKDVVGKELEGERSENR